MVVLVIMVISFVMSGLTVAKAEETGLYFPEKSGKKDGAGTGLLSGGPMIIENPNDQLLHITNSSEVVILTCQASGSDLTGGYWERLNGHPIPKKNNISSFVYTKLDNTMIQLNMIIVRARPAHSGLYHCVVYSRWGITESIPTQVNITVAPPMITMQPISMTADVFQNVTFLCEAVGFKVTYEWARNDSNDIIGNQSKLTVPEITPSDEGYYYCVAINKGGRVTSDVVALTVNWIFTLHPQRATIATGGNITFSTPGAELSYTYHWKRKNGLLPITAVGQNTPHLSILTASPADSGIYHCIVEFPSGYKVKSTRAMLKVYALPVITTHPNDSNGTIVVGEGSDVMLRCEATGEGTLNYQWRRRSGSLPDNVEGNNTTSLTISNITVSDSGEYYCIVDNGGTGVSSQEVQVTAKVKPIIKNCSPNQDLSVISGTERVVLVWEFGGDDLDGITCQRENYGTQETILQDLYILTNYSFELVLDEVRPSDSGEYSCAVYSQWGVAQSRKVKVNITIAPPMITKQPTSKTVSLLENITLTCKAEGFRVVYKWRHNDTTHSANINQSSLTIPQVVPSDAGHYVCIAITEGGKDVSQSAMLTVNEPILNPSNLIVGKGSDVQFNCSIDSPEVIWHIEKQSGTYTTDSSPQMDLYNVSEADSGYYQCSVNVRGEEIKSNQATIAVFGLVDQLNDTIATVGSEVVLRCAASVSATAVSCTWKHDGTAMNTNHTDPHLSLMLSNVSLTDEGSYTCEMKGNAGKPVKSTAKLEVLYVDIIPQNYSVVVGSSTNFTCSPSVSSSGVMYQWLRNGTTMKNETSAVLVITNVKIADGGTYQCVVIVKNTSANTSAQLNTLYTSKPEAISSRNSTSTNLNKILLPISGAVIIITCIVIAASCCCCCCYWCYKRKAPESASTPHEQIQVGLSLQQVNTSLQPANLPPAVESTTSGLDELIGTDQVSERSVTASNDNNVIYKVLIRNGASIIEAINSMQPKILEHIVMLELFPYLEKYGILTTNEKQKLQLNSMTNYEKVQHLLSSILVSKGPEGEKNFIRALYESSKKPGNSGHEELITKLQCEGITVSEISDNCTNALSVNSTDNPSAISTIDDPSAN